MRKTWILLAVLTLAGSAPLGRAEDKKDKGHLPVPPISSTALNNTAKDTVDAADGKDEKKDVIPAPVKEEKKDDGKDYVIPIDAKDAVNAAAETPCTKRSGICCPASPSCRCGRGKECCERIWNWLTYRPLSKPCCCHKCGDCHVPPLYTYFLDNCYAAGCSTCAASTCNSCARQP